MPFAFFAASRVASTAGAAGGGAKGGGAAGAGAGGGGDGGGADEGSLLGFVIKVTAFLFCGSADDMIEKLATISILPFHTWTAGFSFSSYAYMP